MTTQELDLSRAGFGGLLLIADTAAHAGPFSYLLPLSDCVVSMLASDQLEGQRATREITTVGAVADVSSSLNETHFSLRDHAGSVAAWINVDAAGSVPSHGLDRAIEVGIDEDATAEDVAEALAAALDADPAFSATAGGIVVTVTDAVEGGRTDAADVDTGFTVAVTQPGASGPLATRTLPKGALISIPAITRLSLASGTLLAYR